VVVQRREWLDAIANNSVMTRTYFPDHLEPVESQLRLIDTVGPWGEDGVPGREQEPSLPLEERMTEVLPGVFVFRVPGHTWGQQATLFTDTRGRQVVFTPDVMPTAAHVGATYSLSYDVEPYVSMVCRRWFLKEAAKRDWVLVLDHEPGNPVRRVRENGKGWFELVEDGEVAEWQSGKVAE
jgi:glyoxylase-like metal-dependent hydrolase (beta-lactamase superfamily II)